LEDGFAPRDALPVATALIPILTIAPMQGCPAQQSHHCANTLKDSSCLLTAGRLVAKKGFDVLINACAELRRRGVSFRCLLVGGGPLQNELHRQVQEAGLDDVVQLTGWKRFEELVTLYRRASVFIQPSRVTSSGDRDGIPNVLFEAMLFGLPVVATSVSAIPELAVDRVTGLLVPPNNPEELATCVQTLLQDQELAQQIAAAGKRKVEEEFDSTTTTERLVRIYRERITASAMS
jgi:glycosyltransferase involved in cell wall biosynthesis